MTSETVTIERIAAPSRREFSERFLPRAEPVVITDAMRHWPAMTRWTDEFLKDRVGPQSVVARSYRRNVGVAKHEWTANCDFERTTVGEFIDDVAAGRAQYRYLAQLNIPVQLTPLLEDAPRPEFMDRKAQDPVLWMGPGGHVEPLHFDQAHGLLSQVRGSKRFVLFRPTSYFGLYPFAGWSGLAPWFSRVDIDHPDVGRFPRFSSIGSRVEGILHPGEMLFIPFGWWHQISCIDPSCISVTHFFHQSMGEAVARLAKDHWYRTALGHSAVFMVRQLANARVKARRARS